MNFIKEDGQNNLSIIICGLKCDLEKVTFTFN